MRRRDFIAGLTAASAAGTATAALALRGDKPKVGCLGFGTLNDVRRNAEGIQRGLAQTGFVEARDFDFEYRAADYQQDSLRGLAIDLVARNVAVILVLASPALSPAQAATKSIPIAFLTGFDPVANGFVDSFNRPGGNLTGVYILTAQLGSKRLEVLHELVPSAHSVGFLLSSSSLSFAGLRDGLEAAAAAVGVRLVVQLVDQPNEFEGAMNGIVQSGCGAVAVGGDAVFTNNRFEIVARIAQRRLPAIYADREYVTAGGLASYGPDFGEAYRVLGTYAGKILAGQKPADLPVQQITKVELVVNGKTAKELNVSISLPLLARANEVIE